MSLQPPSVYNLMQQVFTMYEEGTLKGKHIRDLENPDVLQKSLEGALSAKLTHFKIFQGLQVIVLNTVIMCTDDYCIAG